MAEKNAREKILKAADRLFGEIGFDAATTREIARKSGANKALIYYHFKNKEALFEAVFESYYQRLTETLQAPLMEQGDLRERMGRLIDTYIDFLSKNRNFARIVQREASGGRRRDTIRDHMIPVFKMGREIIREAYPKTRAGDLAAEQLLITFYGMIITYFNYSGVLESLLGDDPLSKKNIKLRKEHIAKMLDIVLDTIDS